MFILINPEIYATVPQNVILLHTLLSRLFGSEERDFKVKSNDLWTSLAADGPCVTMVVSSLKAALITSGGFPGFKHEYMSFMWPCRTRCTIDIPVLEASWFSSAVNSKMFSRISRHVWIYEKKVAILIKWQWWCIKHYLARKYAGLVVTLLELNKGFHSRNQSNRSCLVLLLHPPCPLMRCLIVMLHTCTVASYMYIVHIQ